MTEITDICPNLVKDLIPYIKQFTPTLKQAMFQATEQSIIARGTWDGCAFNAASKVKKGQGIRGYKEMALLFGVKTKVVERFIRDWDESRTNCPDPQRATNSLRKALEDVGLFSEPEKSIHGKILYIHRERVFTSEETRTKEEFEKIVSNLNTEEILSPKEILELEEFKTQVECVTNMLESVG